MRFTRKQSVQTWVFLLATILFVAAYGFGAGISGAVPFKGADVFIQQNCIACHNAANGIANSRGRLDRTALSYEAENSDNFKTWVKVYDRVSAGEMPPA